MVEDLLRVVVMALASWREAYEELTDFIAEHPEIGISKSFVKIPGDHRPEFYRLFDEVRATFLEEHLLGLLDQVRTLSESYVKAEEDILRLLELSSITLSADLKRFLHDPKGALMQKLFDPFFDLLKGKIDIETFEEETTRNIEGSCRNLYRLGYEKWVTLSLVKLLEADRNLSVSIPEWNLKEMRGHDDFEFEVLKPQESKSISFVHQGMPIYIPPNFIVHSAKIDQYVAFRLQLGRAINPALGAGLKREWHFFTSLMERHGSLDLKHDIIICIDDSPEEVALIADSQRICRPDLIIECMEQKEWHEEDLEKIKLRHDILEPKLGTFILSYEPIPEDLHEKLEPIPEDLHEKLEPIPEDLHEKLGDEIHLLTVGFDQSSLDPIINTLMGTEDETNQIESPPQSSEDAEKAE